MVLALSPLAYSAPSETRFVDQHKDWSVYLEFDLFWDEATAWHAALSNDEWILRYSCEVPDTSYSFERAIEWPQAAENIRANGTPELQFMLRGPWNPIDRIMSGVHDQQSGDWLFVHNDPLPASLHFTKVIARIDDGPSVHAGGSLGAGTVPETRFVLISLTPTHLTKATRLRLLIGNVVGNRRMYDLPLGSGLSAATDWVDLQCNSAPALRRVREQHTREHVRRRLCAEIRGDEPLAVTFREEHC